MLPSSYPCSKEVLSAVSDLSNIRDGRLRIGANDSITLNLLPEITQTLTENYPGVRVELHYNSLRSGCRAQGPPVGLRISLLRTPGERPRVSAHPSGRIGSPYNPKHPFAKHASVNSHDLATEAVIVMDVSSGWHAKMTDTCNKHRTSLNLTVENVPIEAITS